MESPREVCVVAESSKEGWVGRALAEIQDEKLRQQ